MNDKLQSSKERADIKVGSIQLSVPVRAIYVIIIFLVILLMNSFMMNYPNYHNTIMGNDTLPPQGKIIIIGVPPFVFLLTIFIFLYIIIKSYSKERNKNLNIK